MFRVQDYDKEQTEQWRQYIVYIIYVMYSLYILYNNIYYVTSDEVF